MEKDNSDPSISFLFPFGGTSNESDLTFFLKAEEEGMVERRKVRITGSLQPKKKLSRCFWKTKDASVQFFSLLINSFIYWAAVTCQALF